MASGSLEECASLYTAKAELLAHLAQARDDFLNGRMYTSDEVRDMLHARIGSGCASSPTAEDLESVLDDTDVEAASADERLNHKKVFGAAKEVVHKNE
ncbi:MAG: hypothetical protein LUD51_04080 [Clostridia bacterium]|nr:hypothetical protein [Clostridia bacterium]